MRLIPLVPLRVHDRPPDVHAPLAVDHRGDILGGDHVWKTRGGGELGEAKHVQPRFVFAFRARRCATLRRWSLVGVEVARRGEPRRARARRLERGGLHERRVEGAARRAERAEVARVQATQNRQRDVRGEVHERHLSSAPDGAGTNQARVDMAVPPRGRDRGRRVETAGLDGGPAALPRRAPRCGAAREKTPRLDEGL